MCRYPQLHLANSRIFEIFSVTDVLDSVRGNEKLIICGGLEGWIGYEGVLGQHVDQRINEAGKLILGI